MTKAIIFDVDNTLALTGARIEHLRKPQKDWVSFFADQHLDEPHQAVIDVARAVALCPEPMAVLVVTARAEEHRLVTQTWLQKHHVPYQKLYMRPQDDFRKGADVKEMILQNIIDEGYEPIMCFEDQADIAEMFRSYGLTVAQVQPDQPAPRTEKFAGQQLLHMMVGPSGAGKSTYIFKNYRAADVVSSDQVRVQLFGDLRLGHNPDDLALTWRMVHGQVKLRLENGLFTVLDATNLKRKDRLEVLKYVPRGIQVAYVVIDRPYEDKIRDRDWRPEELVDKHHRIFKSSIKDVLRGDDQPNVTVYDKRDSYAKQRM